MSTCKKFKKTKDPKCKDQKNCKWIVGKGCLSKNTNNNNNNNNNTKSNCKKFKKTKDPKCKDQKDCKWAVGKGCIPLSKSNKKKQSVKKITISKDSITNYLENIMESYGEINEDFNINTEKVIEEIIKSEEDGDNIYTSLIINDEIYNISKLKYKNIQLKIKEEIKKQYNIFINDIEDIIIDERIETEDLNYSFLAKLFAGLSNQQKEKIFQVLRNTRTLEKTG